ncbi:hypothetical protein D9M69_679240 [compost metagenome]
MFGIGGGHVQVVHMDVIAGLDVPGCLANGLPVLEHPLAGQHRAQGDLVAGRNRLAGGQCDAVGTNVLTFGDIAPGHCDIITRCQHKQRRRRVHAASSDS